MQLDTGSAALWLTVGWVATVLIVGLLVWLIVSKSLRQVDSKDMAAALNALANVVGQFTGWLPTSPRRRHSCEPGPTLPDTDTGTSQQTPRRGVMSGGQKDTAA